MEKEFYIYLSSRDSMNIFPKNTASDFSLVLPDRLQLKREEWSCGLIDLVLPHAPDEPVYLCSNICQETIVGSRQRPVLRRIIDIYSEPSHVIYVPLKTIELSVLRLYLEGHASGPVSLADGAAYATLHFTTK